MGHYVLVKPSRGAVARATSMVKGLLGGGGGAAGWVYFDNHHPSPCPRLVLVATVTTVVQYLWDSSPRSSHHHHSLEKTFNIRVRVCTSSTSETAVVRVFSCICTGFIYYITSVECGACRLERVRERQTKTSLVHFSLWCTSA